MSKRQVIRDRRRRQRMINRILVIFLVTVGILLIAGVIIKPMVDSARTADSATRTAENSTPAPVVTINPGGYAAAMVDGVHLGDPNAPVKVDVFEDFRCSACLYYSQNFEPQIIQSYVNTGQVYYTYHTYIVIDVHDGTNASRQSANAAMCASEQGRFWDYHQTLFANQVTEDAALFSDERLVIMAQNLGLDMTAFNQCFQEDKYASLIEQDFQAGQALGVSYTPSIFVDNQLTQMDQVGQAIEAALLGK